MGSGTRLRSKHPRLAMTVGLVALVPLACADQDELSLCGAYADLLAQRAAVAALEPSALTAGQAHDVAEDYLSTVRQFRQRADGRYAATIDALEAAVNDITLTLGSVDEDEDYEIWAPLVEEDRETATEAADQLVAFVEPSCAPRDEDGTRTTG